MSDTNVVDIFDGLETQEQAQTADASDAGETSAETEQASGSEESQETPADQPEKAVKTVSEVPDGAMSVTDFAAHMTTRLMRDAIMAGQEIDNTRHYVQPQAVYQTVKAQRDQIPHVLVKGEHDEQPRVYILRDAAEPWWIARVDRLSTRGQGTARASARSSEENLLLLGAAVERMHYAASRRAMWEENYEQAMRLIEKRRGFLKDQKVPDETVELAVQEATDAFNAAQAAKAAEKAKASKKKSAKADNAETDVDDNE